MTLTNKIKIVLVGLGPLGKRIGEGLIKKEGITIVGAVDIAKNIVGKDLGKIFGLDKKLGVIVTNNLKKLLQNIDADIAIIATRSFVKDIYPDIKTCIENGVNVISTCEELSYPYANHPQLAEEIDKLARENAVSVLGTGINPGYLMDTLPITLSGACLKVNKIKVTRMMNSSKRRIPFQKKIGTGLTPEEFRMMIDKKLITGHVGLKESIHMISDALGLNIDSVQEFPPDPIISHEKVETPYKVVEPGHVAGLKSIAYGLRDEEKIITLEFNAHALIKEEYDEVIIEGVPNIHEKIIGGVNGDIGTVAVIINMIPKVLNAEPGLHTMKDLPPPSAIMNNMKIFIKHK